MYAIDFDRPRRVVRLRYSGFWTVATVARFYADLALKAGIFKLRFGPFAVLIDARDFPVQSQPVGEAMRRITERASSYQRGPTAIVVASVLNKMQAERTVPGANTRVFLDMGEAEAWLGREWPAKAA